MCPCRDRLRIFDPREACVTWDLSLVVSSSWHWSVFSLFVVRGVQKTVIVLRPSVLCCSRSSQTAAAVQPPLEAGYETQKILETSVVVQIETECGKCPPDHLTDELKNDCVDDDAVIFPDSRDDTDVSTSLPVATSSTAVWKGRNGVSCERLAGSSVEWCHWVSTITLFSHVLSAWLEIERLRTRCFKKLSDNPYEPHHIATTRFSRLIPCNHLESQDKNRRR